MTRAVGTFPLAGLPTSFSAQHGEKFLKEKKGTEGRFWAVSYDRWPGQYLGHRGGVLLGHRLSHGRLRRPCLPLAGSSQLRFPGLGPRPWDTQGAGWHRESLGVTGTRAGLIAKNSSSQRELMTPLAHFGGVGWATPVPPKKLGPAFRAQNFALRCGWINPFDRKVWPRRWRGGAERSLCVSVQPCSQLMGGTRTP